MFAHCLHSLGGDRGVVITRTSETARSALNTSGFSIMQVGKSTMLVIRRAGPEQLQNTAITLIVGQLPPAHGLSIRGIDAN
jgi:hypothetical protein